MSNDVNRSEHIAQKLRDEILGGVYRPGDRLPPERELATQLGVNRGSVREALKKLEQLGLLSTRRGDGSIVRPLHEASIEVVRHLLQVEGGINRPLLEQLLDVNEMLLSGASYLSVERGSDDALERAREVLRRLERVESVEEMHGVIDELVEIVTITSGNLVLRLFRNAFRPSITGGLQRLRSHLSLDPEGLRAAARALDAAIVARDPAAAEKAVRSLSRLRREHLSKALDAIAARSSKAPRAASQGL